MRTWVLKVAGIFYPNWTPPLVRWASETNGISSSLCWYPLGQFMDISDIYLARAYLVMCSAAFVLLGWDLLWEAIKFEGWNYRAPRTLFILIFVLAVAVGFSVFVMLLWQLYMISSGYVLCYGFVQSHPTNSWTFTAKRLLRTMIMEGTRRLRRIGER